MQRSAFSADGVEWGGRSITRSTPLPISPSNDPTIQRQRMYENHPMQRQESDMDVDRHAESEDDLDLELDFEWKLELDGNECERPGNPVARHFEQNLCTSTCSTPRIKEMPVSKRHRLGSGSLGSSLEGTFGSDSHRQLYEEVTPDRFVHQSSFDHRVPMASSPPSPQHTFRGHRPHQPVTSVTASSPNSPPAVALVPRYYAGGPVNRVETPRTPQRASSDGSSKVQASPSVPGWRGGHHVGSTPPSIFYPKAPELPRGGGVSPLRDLVIRNLGIS